VINHMIKVHMKKGGYSYTCHFCWISTKSVAGIHWHLGEFHKFNFMKKADKYLWSYTVIENGGKCSTCSSTFETLQSYKNHSPCHSAENSSLYTSYQFIKNGGKCSSCLETWWTFPSIFDKLVGSI
jgi:Fe-S cluster biogenesis protein NfuA